ncbi:CorA family divalent cation transporter [Stenotrophomonas sp. MMGLT7]|uniref:CorA family divalent cation transporter n=1 Tax=Stenotrophomonas sp. MMGLT7 TaxID=2901227 RepID=UPI001E46D22F|nr:CorA family divalent cation transporter [Stenotrophomonas sp. MMGLT7]MCD7097796.1 magnesium transporter [Stenotrophomonas sp. MMGLT7]
MITIHSLSTATQPGGSWVDLCQPNPEDLEKAAHEVGFEIPDRARISEIEFSSRVRSVGDVLFLNLPRFQEGETSVAPLGFALSPTALVTQREHPLASLETIEHDIGHHPCQGSVDLFLRIVEHIVDRLADRLESLEAEVTDTTRDSFDDRQRLRDRENALRRVGNIGRRLGAIHNTVLGLLRIVTYLTEAAPAWFGEAAPQRLKLIHKDLLSLSEFEQQLGDRLEFLLDSVLGLINTDQNEVMKVMAVASVVGVPPTVLVGIWGMNFAYMPELAWHPGYFVALGAVALSMALPLLWFRRRHWI